MDCARKDDIPSIYIESWTIVGRPNKTMSLIRRSMKFLVINQFHSSECCPCCKDGFSLESVPNPRRLHSMSQWTTTEEVEHTVGSHTRRALITDDDGGVLVLTFDFSEQKIHSADEKCHRKTPQIIIILIFFGQLNLNRADDNRFAVGTSKIALA